MLKARSSHTLSRSSRAPRRDEGSSPGRSSDRLNRTSFFGGGADGSGSSVREEKESVKRLVTDPGLRPGRGERQRHLAMAL